VNEKKNSVSKSSNKESDDSPSLSSYFSFDVLPKNMLKPKIHPRIKKIEAEECKKKARQMPKHRRKKSKSNTNIIFPSKKDLKDRLKKNSMKLSEIHTIKKDSESFKNGLSNESSPLSGLTK
jgi:hypothetical protein